MQKQPHFFQTFVADILGGGWTQWASDAVTPHLHCRQFPSLFQFPSRVLHVKRGGGEAGGAVPALWHYNFTQYDFYTALFGVSRAMGALSRPRPPPLGHWPSPPLPFVGPSPELWASLWFCKQGWGRLYIWVAPSGVLGGGVGGVGGRLSTPVVVPPPSRWLPSDLPLFGHLLNWPACICVQIVGGAPSTVLTFFGPWASFCEPALRQEREGGG